MIDFTRQYVDSNRTISRLAWELGFYLKFVVENLIEEYFLAYFLDGDSLPLLFVT